MPRLLEILKLFLRLGVTAFGGPAAHIAMLETEVVERRRWLSRRHFLDLVGATQLVPGPNSTEMVMHVGFERGRWLGLVAAAVGFIGPAAAITLACAWAYVSLGRLPAAGGLLAGIQPVVVAVILAALWRLGKKAVGDVPRGLIAIGVFAAVLYGFGEIPALLVGGVLGTLFLRLMERWGGGDPGGEDSQREPDTPGEHAKGLTETGPSRATKSAPGKSAGSAAALVMATPTVGVAAAPAMAPFVGTAPQALWPLALFFLKVGAILYGSGYVLIAFIEGGLVEELGWLTSVQLLDAVAIGQLTPGPVLTTATFVGYLVAGVPGALVATLAIFLPSAFFVALLNPLVPRLRRNRWTAAFLDAVNAAAVALMAAVTLQLAAEALASWPRLLLFGFSAAVLLRTKTSPAWLVFCGAMAGLLLGPRLG